MLNPKTLQTIESYVPVLAEQGATITTRFYQILFQKHPELLNVFNKTHQVKGTQPRALAHSVYMAVKHIQSLEQILPVVELIAHKHRSLGVLPEHYPVVGENLTIAMEEVLGDAFTPELKAAWIEVYEIIANAFIEVEGKLYREAIEQPGGWAGFRNFVIDRKVKESDVITSFYLKPVDQKPIASFKPGQYVSLDLSIPGQPHNHKRQYSLSDAPHKDYYRISVKREDAREDSPAGIVSSYLHDDVQVGDVLPVSAPAGVFTLNTDNPAPLVLISGGVGLTPLMSMLEHTLEATPDRRVLFVQATINGHTHAMQERLKALSEQHSQLNTYTFYTFPTDQDRKQKKMDGEGFIQIHHLDKILSTTDIDCYLCGPTPFMSHIYQLLSQLGVAEENIHYEFFGSMEHLQKTK
ncbi:NO-inducible flavohemoprotein [Hazenella sp. IB182357]|uniref:Flavohemoprotein n=1 Tax=Polycladospora coralii TaxID=2771432 RepID=A0A926NEB4_9BACL|nr:NO-inducible flavohemoprotein [Polycladospora coralii]MBD1371868.1 NO-inducible flavohemoprotein [Polycladospora coralii]MBS7529329.1 NO-inducible flavohemoprotein [Polycladospora coralii]